jgi:drug/metabolite transporter (DMT)-like permease
MTRAWEFLRRRPAIAAGLAILLWASAFPAIRIALEQFDPLPLAAARFGIASVPAIAWLTWRRPAVPSPRDLLQMLACGAIGIALYNVLLNTGQKTVSPAAASFIIATQPLFAGLLAGPILGEHVSRRAWIGSLIGLLGVGIIAVGGAGLTLRGAGVLLVLAAAACSGSYFVMQRPLVQRHGALTSASATILCGAALLSPGLPYATSHITGSARSTGALLFLALGAGVLAYPCWLLALERLGAARAARWLFLIAPIATAMNAVMTWRLPGPTLIAGGALALIGVAFSNSRDKTAPPRTAQ